MDLDGVHDSAYIHVIHTLKQRMRGDGSSAPPLSIDVELLASGCAPGDLLQITLERTH